MPRLHELFGLNNEQAEHSLWFLAVETLVAVIIFTVIVECAGRKTVAQMTMLQMIVTIGIGEALLMPIVDIKFSLFRTIIIVGTLILYTIVIEFLEVKIFWFERLITNKSILVVEDGKVVPKNLKKLRMTVDQLEMQIRNLGVDSITLLKTATVEANGQLGWQLTDDSAHLTVKDFKDYMEKKFPSTNVEGDIFEEVRDDEHGIEKKHTTDETLK
jgi:uncharacterized membrane protein YcaP (DUF421 family)